MTGTRARTGARTGRRPGETPTRRQILDAARDSFSAKGFRGATVRAIAGAAEVDPALILHYFGSKEDLFAATLEFPEDAVARLQTALHGDPEGIGERLTRAYLELWENPETRSQMVIVVRSGFASDDAMSRLRPVIQRMLGEVYTTATPRAHPEAGFALAMAQLLGVACVRHITAIPPLRDLPFDDLVAQIAPTIQIHLTGA
jgi:AcrR family transcriptional regulator